jgi:endonuclease YncB( thermonuclease family)
MGNCLKKNSTKNQKKQVSNNDLDYLENIEYKDTIPFIFPITHGKVVKIYDGDTITIASKLPYNESPIYRFQVRLNGIDTPEIKGKTNEEKELAKTSKNTLNNMIYNKIVRLEKVSNEKYGRILAEVYLGDTNINKYMISSCYAVEYDGGTKKRPREWGIINKEDDEKDTMIDVSI